MVNCLQVDGHEVLVDSSNGKVKSTNSDLGSRVETSVSRMLAALRPVQLSSDMEF